MSDLGVSRQISFLISGVQYPENIRGFEIAMDKSRGLVDVGKPLCNILCYLQA
jgi:hypothetical protein